MNSPLPGRAPSSPPSDPRPRVLYVSAVGAMKGGAETVLAEMLRSPHARPALAVPEEGALADLARSLGAPVGLYDLGMVGRIRRPAPLRDQALAARDALRMAARLDALARETGADLVHTNGLKPHVAGLLARRRHGTRVVVHMHDLPYTRQERWLWRALRAGAHHVVAASPLCFPDLAGRPHPRVSVVMQGVDHPPAAGPRTLPDRPVLGFVGRIHPYKGLHHLLDWFEPLADAHPRLSLLVRGRADDEGAGYWEALRPRVERLAAAGRARLEGWRPAGEDPLLGVDLLAAPSSTPEVGPRVIMEAMLRAIPAIGWPTGGAPSMIPDPALGALAGDGAAFRAALDRLLEPARYAAASAAALAHATRAFGIGRFHADLAAAHAAALGLPPRPAPARPLAPDTAPVPARSTVT